MASAAAGAYPALAPVGTDVIVLHHLRSGSYWILSSSGGGCSLEAHELDGLRWNLGRLLFA
jgi:hypothetical protein